MAWVVHNAGGRIVQTVEGDVDDTFGERVASMGNAALKVTLPSILDVPINSIYVADGQVTPRPTFPATHTGDTVTGLPNPSTLTIASSSGSQTVTVTDGTLEITSDVPDTFTITATVWPYLDWSATVTGT